jgi:hypothetical protein
MGILGLPQDNMFVTCVDGAVIVQVRIASLHFLGKGLFLGNVVLRLLCPQRARQRRAELRDMDNQHECPCRPRAPAGLGRQLVVFAPPPS